MKAEMKIEVLPDGRIKITTGKLQGEHHVSAEQFVRGVGEMMGDDSPEVISMKGHGEHHHHGGHHHTH